MNTTTNLPIYSGTSYPDTLKPRTTLYKLGLRALEEPVAITRKRGGQEYFLYDVSKTETLTLETATKDELRYWRRGLQDKETLTEEEQRVLGSSMKKLLKKKKKGQSNVEPHPSGVKLSTYLYKSHKRIIECKVNNSVVEALNLPIYQASNRPSYLLTPRELLDQNYTFNGSMLAVMEWETGLQEYLYAYEPHRTTNWKTLLDEALANPKEYLILDTETTGLDWDDEVIQLTCLDIEGNIVYDGYFNPTKASHWAAAKKHKLSTDFLAQQPKWEDEWAKISTLLEGKTILAHNADFDHRLLQQTCLRYNLEPNLALTFVCTMPFVKALTGENSLEKALDAMKYRTGSESLHNSRTDCFMLLKLLLPKQEVFKIQETAQHMFERVCRYKIEHRQEPHAVDAGWNWIQSNFQLLNRYKDFKVLDQKICQAIVHCLKPTVAKLDILNFE